MAATKGEDQLLLPELRQDLQIMPGAPTIGGTPTWVIKDPVRHRYFQVSSEIVDLLTCWAPDTARELRSRVVREFGYEPDEAVVDQVVRFVYANNLTLTSADGDPLAFAAQIKGARRAGALRLVHGYLFFRVPLVRPDRFLQWTMPLVDFLFSRVTQVCIVLITIGGLYLASRQWDAFQSTFLSFLTLEGSLCFAAAIIFVKVLHELGHAYTATRFGVRVNTMGVAFMVLMPLLYTDVSDAWRLSSRRRKLAIDAAGLSVELAVAGIATFVWAFLPDGPMRAAVFVLASTSWVLSVFVNVNPFMRFDGYYLLSDAWGIPNLQPRAFQMAKWWLRECLFDLGEPPPEAFQRATRRRLVVYAIATWVYRLVLFIGIALIVYHMFFKVLGVALFVVEVFWFIALPVIREVNEWWKVRGQIMRTRRTYVTIALAGLLGLAVFVPWNRAVVVPAVTWAEADVQLFPPRPARLADLRLRNAMKVATGDVVATFVDRELDHKRRQAARRIALLEARLSRLASGSRELANRAVLISQLRAAKQDLRGLDRENERLTLRAPVGGIVRDVPSGLDAERFVGADQALGRIIRGGGRSVQGYIEDESLWRVTSGSRGVFIPDAPFEPSRRVRVTEIAPAGADRIDLVYLASNHGGPIASDRLPNGDVRARAGQYRVRFTVVAGDRASSHAARRVMRGVVHLNGRPESFAAGAWRRVLKVLVRESGI